MTQTLTKGTAGHTLRRKLLVTASSIALVAGMGVALAPSAAAAQNNSLAMTVNDVEGTAAGDGGFPTVMLDAGTAKGWLTVKNTTGAKIVKETATPANKYQVDIAVSGTGLGQTTAGTITIDSALFGNQTLDAATNGDDSRTLKTTVALVEHVSDNSLGAVLSNYGTVFSNTLDVTAGSLVTGATEWRGNLTVTVSVVERTDGNSPVATLGTARFTTKIAEQADAKLVAAKDVPAPAIHSDYSANVVTDVGVLPDTFTISAAGTTPPTLTTVDGITTWKDGVGNKFAFDTETGVISAKAADLKKINKPTDVKYTVQADSSTATVNVTFSLDVGFTDDAHIAKSLNAAVYAAVKDGIVEGYDDGTFRPVAPVTRQAMAAFLYRLDKGDINAKAPSCTSQSPSGFTDVAVSHPFCGEIRWLATTGVTTGYDDGTFRASDPITRRAIAAMLYRVNQLKDGYNSGSPSWSAPAPTTSAFNDVATTAPFAGEIKWAYDAGVTNGYDDGGYHPGANSSRQATVTFLSRMP